jgi:dihydroorotate dehydrogenase electron transfer subunit
MSVNSKENTFDLLYKVVGDGTRELSKRKVGEQISVMGPIGNGFNFDSVKRPIMIGGGVGIPPMVALAQQLNLKTQKPLAIFGSEVEFPFEMEITDKSYPFIEKPATMSLLREWGIDCLLTSNSDFQGVYKGYVTDLARDYLNSLSAEELKEVKIFACGPDIMLKAVKILASQLNVECELSLEEFMACAIGGCAGCVVEVKTEAGKSMKRVCVDGPIFDANSIFQ